MFTFYGSKFKLAPLYPEPTEDKLIEPFAGSAKYSLLYHDRQVVLFDADPRIIEVWNFLIGASRKDIEQLPIIAVGERIDKHSQLSRVEQLFLGYMVSAATRNPKRTATVKTNWTENKRKAIAGQVGLVKHWKAYCKSFEKILNQKATWYVDPPYQGQGKWYDHFLTPEQYSQLAIFCRSRFGQVIVAENEEATWLPFRPLVRHAGQKNNNRMEAIWTNEVSIATDQ